MSLITDGLALEQLFYLPQYESFTPLATSFEQLFEGVEFLNKNMPYYEFKGRIVRFDEHFGNMRTVTVELNPKINTTISDDPKILMREYLKTFPSAYNEQYAFIESKLRLPNPISASQINIFKDRQYTRENLNIPINVVYYGEGIRIPATIIIRDFYAPYQSNFSTKQSWNVTKDNCCIDYLVAKLRLKHEDIPLKQNGVTLEEFTEFLSTKTNYYICNPFLIITHKHYNDNLRNSIYLLINNSHIYPIENSEIQREFHHKSIGQKLISITAQTSFTESIDDIIKQNLKNNILPSFVNIENNAVKSVTYDDITYIECENLEENQKMARDFDIEYNGQSTSKLAFDIINKYKRLPAPCIFTELNYNKFMQKQPHAITRYFSQDATNTTSLDINRFYTSLLYNSVHEWPLIDSYAEFTTFDQTYPLKLGFYRINKFVDDHLYLEKNCLISSALANYLLEEQLIKLSDITEQLLATRKMPADYFKETIEYYYKTESPFLKSLFNYFIGMTGSVKKTNSAGFLTTDLQTALYYYGKGYQFKTFDGYYQVYYHTESNKLINYRPIFAQVMNLSFIYMHKLKKSINAEIVAIKTDCLILRNYNIKHPEKSTSLKSVGKVCTEKTKFNYRECHFNNDYIEYKRIWHEVYEIKDCCLITGPAGTGKTTLINKYLEDKSNYLITSMSHMALSNYKKNKLVMQAIINLILRKELPKIKTLIVDEFTMLNKEALNALYTIKSTGTNIILIGDENQAYGIDNSPINKNNQIFGELVNWNILRLTKQYRSDERLIKLHNDFLTNSKLNSNVQTTNQISPRYLHLCYTNKKVNEINELLKDKPVMINGTPYIPYISKANTKNLFNNQRIYYHNKKYYDLNFNEIKITKHDKIKQCYAMTIHCSQGQTLSNVVIHEPEKITKDLMYVAISRVKSFDDLYFYRYVPTKIYDFPTIEHECVQVSNVKYGLIYKFFLENKLVNIGYCEAIHEFDEVKNNQDEKFDRYEVKKYSYNTIEDLIKIVKKQTPNAKPPVAANLEFHKYSIMIEKEYVSVYDNETKKRVKRFKIGKKDIEKCKELANEFILNPI